LEEQTGESLQMVKLMNSTICRYWT